MEVDEELVYEIDLEILNIYPKIELTGRWELKDENDEDFLCVTIPIKIED